MVTIEIDGVKVFYDGMFMNCVTVDVMGLKAKTSAEKDQILQEAAKCGFMLEMIEQRVFCGSFSEQFFSKRDLLALQQSNIVCEAYKQEIRDEIVYREMPWTRPSPTPRGKKDTRDSSGYVYLVRADNDTYKIGVSKKPIERVRSMGVVLPYELDVLHVIKTDDAYALEKRLHEQFSAHRLSGEWFDLSDDEIQKIVSIEGQPA